MSRMLFVICEKRQVSFPIGFDHRVGHHIDVYGMFGDELLPGLFDGWEE